MKTSIKIIILSFVSLLFCSTEMLAERDDVSDSLEISLLTCSPGDASYELYGHTALRVKDFKRGDDMVFNYGIFDFDTPNFAWRFMLGETDYTIGVSNFSSFAHSYRRHGRCVVEQVLNLTSEEKERVVAALTKDWATPGWTYRYNFIYDNCTTRAVAQIEKALEAKLVWPESENGKRSFRQILHEFASEKCPWTNFGDDLLLGCEVDEPIGVRQQLFSPVYAERFLDVAYVLEKDGTRRDLVLRKELAVQALSEVVPPFFISPMIAALVLLFISMAVSVREYKKQKLCFGLDYLLMFIQGLAGCIIAFMFFFSEHPAVGTNWLIILLNPVPLIYLPVKIWRDRRGFADHYYVFVAVALFAFAVSAVCQVQDYPAEIYIMALILLLRTMLSLHFGRKMRIK